MKNKVYILVCNHYDLAWRRRAYGGLYDKGLRYASYEEIQRYGIIENIRFCRQYPFYKFNIESVSVLRCFLRSNPEYAEKLCSLIRENRCSTPQCGDNIIDVNLVSGESMVRNFVYGRRYMKENFDIVTPICVRNDAFGNSAQLPQIAKQCGCDWIWGLSYSPVTGTYWRGLDGSTLFVGAMPNAGTGGSWKKYAPCPACRGEGCAVCDGLGITRKAAEDDMCISFSAEVADSQSFSLLSSTSEELLPQQALIDWYLAHQDAYDVRFATFNDLHEVMAEQINRQPAADELHNSPEQNPNNTGCYSSRLRTKQDIRRLEYRTMRLERLLSLLRLSGKPISTAVLDEVWERLLTMMTHDIITGPHVDAVYEDYLQWVDELDALLDETKAAAVAPYTAQTEDCVTVYNPSEVVFTDSVRIADPDAARVYFTDAAGKAYPILSRTGGVCRVQITGLAPGSSLTLYRHVADVAATTAEKTQRGAGDFANILQAQHPTKEVHAAGQSSYQIENERYLIHADEQGLLSVYDKKNARTVSLAEGDLRPAGLRYEHDDGSPWATLSADHTTVPVRTRLLGHRQGEDSSSLCYEFYVDSTAAYAIYALRGEMEISLRRASDRVDIRLHMQSDDYNHRLRILFPAPQEGDYTALYGIPHGKLERQPYTPSYYWAGSNGDWPAINWAGISRAEGSLAVLNRGTPSYRIEREGGVPVLAISLLRSPANPTYLHEPTSYSMTAWDSMRDAGDHTVELALAAYAGRLEDSTVMQEAEAYNLGAITVRGSLPLPAMPQVEKGSLQVVSLHPTHDGRLALRLLESDGKPTEARLRLPACVRAVLRTDITEEGGSPLPLSDQTATLSATPYEIVTLLLAL